MKRTWTIIGVSDVASSFKWYQSLFGQPKTPPGHDDFGQILDTDGTVLLCLHQWRAHGHPSLMSPDEASPGNGLLLFFRVDDFGPALKRARALVTRFEEEPHVNPNTQTREFSLRDPDGYYVTISALSAPQRRRPARRRPNKGARPNQEVIGAASAPSRLYALIVGQLRTVPSWSKQMNYKGSCHCGRVSFEVEGTLEQAIECNCSHCSRKGYLLWFVPPTRFKLLTPESGLATYTFNNHVIKHHFCSTCGCAPFGFGKVRSGAETALINVRCLEGVELSLLKKVPVDGRSF